MIRGTTPTFTLNMLDEQLDLRNASNVYATFKLITPDTDFDYLSQVTVLAIPYTETANTYGTTVTIG